MDYSNVFAQYPRIQRIRLVNLELKGKASIRYNSSLKEYTVTDQTISKPFSDVGKCYTDNLTDAINTAYAIASRINQTT